MGQIFFQRKKKKRTYKRKKGPVASVVWDTQDLTVTRVYIGFTAREALRMFLTELQRYHPQEDSDSLSELHKAIDRYKIEEIRGENVVMRRHLLKYKLEF